MSLLFFTNGGAVTSAVQLPANNFRTFAPTTPVYSGLKIDADGGLYEMTPEGTWSRFATWLLAGTNTGFYVSRIVDEGILTVDAGAGPLQCNADREYYLKSEGRQRVARVAFELSTDVSGSPVVANALYTFSALGEREEFVGGSTIRRGFAPSSR